jgi:hypothetical protein
MNNCNKIICDYGWKDKKNKSSITCQNCHPPDCCDYYYNSPGCNNLGNKSLCSNIIITPPS